MLLTPESVVTPHNPTSLSPYPNLNKEIYLLRDYRHTFGVVGWDINYWSNAWFVFRAGWF